MTFFQRMLATSDRDCDNCGEEGAIPEGEVYWQNKREEKFCRQCREYEEQHEA